ncbi:MAG: hypothetical protein K6F41_05830 [Lachnospira sp.]|uniref:Uncharacterized protein n=1 Tax=Lachnospira pectinoschiza TaxID=28052 RepID=A0A1G9VCQ5_9FIRM|nr:hypothetical protein [Lachnospira pectinoschiza]MCR5515962.1 hypothetical protein [Lachnospira sp.]SDM70048.1 hypothetical protein SAMN05216544_0913 [Lachnospira pectinoschiza]
MVVLTTLGGEICYEAVKFVVYIAAIVCACMIGGKLRKSSDAKKAAKAQEEDK